MSAPHLLSFGEVQAERTGLGLRLGSQDPSQPPVPRETGMARGPTGTLHPLILGGTEVLTTSPSARWVRGRGGAVQNRPRVPRCCQALSSRSSSPPGKALPSQEPENKLGPLGWGGGTLQTALPPPETLWPRGDLFHPNDANLPTPGAAKSQPPPRHPHALLCKARPLSLGPAVGRAAAVFPGSGSSLVQDSIPFWKP